MRKLLIYGAGVLLLVILFTLVVWQGSFSFGEYGPSSPEQTYALWAVSTLIFLLTITLSFMLVRNFVRLYIERRSNREGSRIRTKLVIGALALTSLPVLFLVLFSFYVLNRSLERWFTRPAENIKMDFVAINKAISTEHSEKVQAQADLIATDVSVTGLMTGKEWPPAPAASKRLCRERHLLQIVIEKSTRRLQLCEEKPVPNVPAVAAHSEVIGPAGERGRLIVLAQMPVDLGRIFTTIENEVRVYDQLAVEKKRVRLSYLQLLILIALFILFFATWAALFLSKQISVPIAALLGGAHEVRSGNLRYRLRVRAIDELATLVRGFNEMTAALEANSLELEKRRRFTEAILESIPTGVMSVTADGRIQMVNRALTGLIPSEQVNQASRLEDLFGPEDGKEVRYLMSRAKRVGIAASQFDIRTAERKNIPLSVTVAALDDRSKSGFVVVLEDTSDLQRAQKFAAWHEIARRIAHEIKNPLTPISLCAERIARQLDRRATDPQTDAVLRECSALITAEVETLKALVNEFSQFSRFPAAQRVPSDLNEIVESALGVFQGRLDGIDIVKELGSGLPQVNIDRDQFKRLVVNLVDNAAEAMSGSATKSLYVCTSSPGPDTVELVVADSGCGVSAEDREKLFLPYFSTKGRGTGLGLAIVNHIVSDHGALIRVEDNQPVGARFIVELPALNPLEPPLQTAVTVESQA